MSLTHVQKLKLQDHNGIVLIEGETPHGDPMYAYVEADQLQIEEIYHAYEQGDVIDFSMYKKIIKHEWGVPPSENVRQWMERYYGFKHSG